MAREYARSTRVAEQLRRELSELVRFGVKDPRVEGASITDVEVSKDLSYAKVYFSRLEDDAEAVAEMQKGLTRAGGYLRRELGKILRMRHVPELRFVHDRSLAEGMRMDELIARARERDRRGGSED